MPWHLEVLGGQGGHAVAENSYMENPLLSFREWSQNGGFSTFLYAPTWQKNMSSSTESISLHPPDDLLVSNLPIWTNIEAKDFTLC